MKTYKGATLVGSLIAITILTITIVPLLNLQATIARARFFLQYDNTANLLSTEGIEIVRAIAEDDPNSLPLGTYFVDYKTKNIDSTSDCDTGNLNQSCALSATNDIGYVKGDRNDVFYRFVKIEKPSSDRVQVTSTVVVKNPRSTQNRVYSTFTELFKLN
ncbi:MAG: hypothetical protein RLZZ223_506 [Candidatus Parcubacteria bacterium]|jgi:hypothetical protein